MNEIWITASVGFRKNGSTDCRSWYWFPNEEDAIASITQGHGPSFYSEAGYYSYAVIERIPYEGQIERQEMWFELTPEKATPCEKPERLKQIVCFTIG